MNGNCWAVRCCLKTYANKDISLFRFSKDPIRCKVWATACNRLDLFYEMLATGCKLYDSYHRVCSIHFTTEMFTSNKRKRLHIDAAPSRPIDNSDLFPTSALQPEVVEEAKVQQSSKVRMESSPGTSSIESIVTTVGTITCVTGRETPTCMTTQTDKNLRMHIPRKEALRSKIKGLQNKTATLQRNLDVLNLPV